MNTCSICLDEIHLDDSINLSCEHIFHKRCVEKCIDHKMKSIEYGTNKVCCPNCRTNITELNDEGLNKKLKELHQKPEPIPNIPEFHITPSSLVQQMTTGIQEIVINNQPIRSFYGSTHQARIINNINMRNSIRDYLSASIINNININININNINMGNSISESTYEPIIDDLTHGFGHYNIEPTHNNRVNITISRPPLSMSLCGYLIENRNRRLVTRRRLSEQQEQKTNNALIYSYINAIIPTVHGRHEQKNKYNSKYPKHLKGKKQKNFKMRR